MEYRIVKNTDESGIYFSVVDDDGYPINDGHFLDITNAVYVRDEMNTGKYWGDYISSLCKSLDSWVVR